MMRVHVAVALLVAMVAVCSVGCGAADATVASGAHQHSGLSVRVNASTSELVFYPTGSNAWWVSFGLTEVHFEHVKDLVTVRDATSLRFASALGEAVERVDVIGPSIEHSIDVPAWSPERGHPTGATIHFGVSHPERMKTHVDETGETIVFTLDGRPVMTYAKFVVLTADQKPVQTQMRVNPDTAVLVLEVAVDALSEHSYPLVLDPLSSNTDYYYFTGQGVAGWPDGDGQLFGFALAVGEFNGDSLLDIAITAPANERTAGSNDRMGAVFIYHGLSQSPMTFEDDTSRFAFIAPSSGSAEAFMGCSIAAGKWDGDTDIDDLVFGAFRETGGGFPNPDGDGTVGSANALRGAWYHVEDGSTGKLSSTLNFPGEARRFGGWSVAACDVVAEFPGREMPFIGVPYDSLSIQGQGDVAAINALSNYKFNEITNPLASATNAKHNDGFFSAAMCSGDFDNDGNDDFVITAHRAWDDKVFQGNVQIWYGPISKDPNADGSPDVRGALGIVHLYGPQVGSGFGWSCDTADLNNDGIDDLIVGSPWYSDNYPDQGRIDVYYGVNTAGIASTATPDWSYNGDSPDELLGYAVLGMMDMNLDGIDDLIASAPFYGDNNGRVYSFHGKQGGLTQTQGNADGITFGPAPEDMFGFSLAQGGDFNGDGYNDAVAGGWGHVESVGAGGNGTVGRVWILLGQPLADLEVTISGPASVEVPSTVVLNVQVTNHGPETDVVRFTLSQTPNNLEMLSSTASCTQACASCTVICALGTMVKDDTTAFTITLDAGFDDLGEYVSTAEALSDASPARLDEDGAVDILVTAVQATSDVRLDVMAASPNPVEAGMQVTFFFDLSVNPASISPSVNTILSLEGIPLLDASIVSVDAPGANIFGSLFISFGTLLQGESRNASVTLRVASIPSVDELDITGRVLTDSTDTQPLNNVRNVTVPIVIVADLQLFISLSPTTLISGNAVGITFAVQNLGGSTGAGVWLNFSVPTGGPTGAFQLNSINSGGFPCTSLVDPVTLHTNYSCALGDMIAFTSNIVSVFGELPFDLANPGDQLLISAETGSDTLDTYTGNNRASRLETIGASADLNVFSFASVATGFSNDTIGWGSQITNLGPSRASNVEIYTTLPIHAVDYLSVDVSYSANSTSSPAVCAQVASSSLFRCSIDHLDPSAQATILYSTVVLPSAPGIITTYTLANSTVDDPRTADNQDDVSVSIITGSDLWLGTMVTDPAAPCAGQPVSYNFGIVSLGPEDAANVLLNHTLPAGTTFVTATSPECSYDADIHHVLCVFGTVPVATTVSATVLLTIDSNTLGPIDSSAVVSTTSPDYFVDNDVASVSLPVCYTSGLSVIMLGLPTSVPENSEIFLAITVTNSGPSDARQTSLDISLPAGSELTTVDPSCAVVAGTVATGLVYTCPVGPAGTIALGQRIQFDLVMSVNATVGNITTVANVSSAISNDLFMTDNRAEVVTTIEPGAVELALFISDTSDPILTGEPLTQIYTIFNTGSLQATGTKLRVAADPAVFGSTDAFLLAENPAGCTWDDTAAVAWCPVPDMAAFGGSATLNLVFHPSIAFIGTTVHEGHVTSLVYEAPSNLVNNNATQDTEIQRNADLSVIATITPNPVFTEAPSNTIGVSLVITNLGPSVGPNGILYNTLPPGFSYTGVTAADGGPSPVNCTLLTTAPPALDVSQVIQCPLPTVALYEQITVVAHATILPGYPEGTVVNTANVTIDADPVDTNNEATTNLVVALPSVDVSVSGIASPSIVAQIDSLSMPISIANSAVFVARDVALVIDLPAGIVFDTISQQENCSVVSAGNGRDNPTQITCAYGSLNPGTYSQLMALDVNATSEGTYTVNLTISTSTEDTNTDNDFFQIDISVFPINADLAVQITDLVGADNSLLGGNSLQMVFTVFNTGTALATGSQLVVTVNKDAITGFPVALNPGTCSWDAGQGQVTCALGNLDVGDISSPTLTFTTSVVFDGLITTEANVSTSAFEVITTNNYATETTQIVRLSDLSVNVFVTPTTVYETNPFVVTVVITNAGPSPVAVNDTSLVVLLPGDASLSAVNDVDSFGHDCSFNTLGMWALRCRLAAMPVGDTSTITISMVMVTRPVLPLDGIALINGTISNPYDSELDNNKDGAVLTVPTSFVDTSIVLAATPTTIYQEDTLFVSGTITNTGPAIAEDLNVIFTLPFPHVEVLAINPADNCTLGVPSFNQIICRFGDQPIGDTSVDISLSANVSASVDALVFTGNISTTTDDPVTANDNDAVTVPVLPSYVNLQIFLSNLADPVEGGSLAQQIVSVINAGNTRARDVRVFLTLSEHVTYDAASSATFCTPQSTHFVVCTLSSADLGPNGGATSFTIGSVTQNTEAVAAFQLHALVNGSKYELDTDDNSATLDAQLTQLSEVSVLASASPNPSYVGRNVLWTATITNAGPSVASNNTVRFDLPAEVSYLSMDSAPLATNCTFAAASHSVSCELAVLAPGVTVQVSILTLVDSMPNLSIMQGNVTAWTKYDTVPAGSDSAWVSIGNAFGDLQVSGQGFPDLVPQINSQWFLSLTVYNGGPFASENVVLSVDMPFCFAVTSITSQSAHIVPSANCTTGVDPVDRVCQLGTVGVGESILLTFAADANCSSTLGDLLAIANVTTSTNDRSTEDDAAVVSLSLVPVNADLSVFITDVSDPTLSGSPLQQTYTIFNTGTDVARDVKLRTTILHPSAIVAFQTGINPPGCSYDAGTAHVICPVQDLQIGDVASLTLSYATSNLYEGRVSIFANVTTSTFEVAFDNNVATENNTLARRSDVALDVFATPDPVYESFQLFSTFVVLNNGPSPAEETVLTGTLPGPSTVALPVASSLGGDLNNCTVMADVPGDLYHLSCQLVDLAVGESTSISVVAVILGKPPSGDHVWVNGSLSNTQDVFFGNNFAAERTLIGDPFVDVSISIEAVPTTITQEDNLFLAVSVDNAGPAIARDVTAQIVLPGTITLDSLVNPNCSVTAAGPPMIIDCDFGDMSIESHQVAISLTTDIADGVTRLAPTAEVNTTTLDTALENNNAAVNITVDPSYVQLTLFVVDLEDPIFGGALFQQVWSIFNTGVTASLDTVLEIWHASALTLEPTSNCTAATSTKVVCSIPDIPKGDAFALTLNWAADRWEAGTLESRGRVTNSVLETQLDDNNATETTTLNQDADLGVSLGAFPPTVFEDWTLTFEASFSNLGPSGATDVTLDFEIPEILRAGPGSWSTDSPAFVNCTLLDAGARLACTAGDLAFGEGAVVSVQRTVGAGVSSGDLICANVTVDSPRDISIRSNNDVQSCGVVGVPYADIQVAAGVNPREIAATVSTPITIFVTVSNASPYFTSFGVLADVEIPSTMVINAAWLASPAGANCTDMGAFLRCTLGDIPLDNAVSFTVEAQLTEPVIGTREILVNASSPITPDPSPANSGDTVSVDVVEGFADLFVIINDFSNPASAGGTAAQAVTIFNQGIVAASEVVVIIDLMPVASSWPPNNPSFCELIAATRVRCNVSSIASNDVESITVLYGIAETAEGPYVTEVSASTATLEHDLSNNYANTTTIVEQNADITVFAISVPAQPAPIYASFPFTLLTVVSNAIGPNEARNVRSTATLPEQVSLHNVTVDMDNVNCTYHNVSHMVECFFPNLARGELATVSMEVIVETTGNLTYVANVFADNDKNDGPDSNEAVWTAEATYCQTALVLGGFTNAGTNPVYLAGENGTLHFYVQNPSGPQSAYNLVLEGELDGDMHLALNEAITVDTGSMQCSVTAEGPPLTWRCEGNGEFRIRDTLEVVIPFGIPVASNGGNWTLSATLSSDTCVGGNAQLDIDVEVIKIVTRNTGTAVAAPSSDSGLPLWLYILIGVLILLCLFLILFASGAFKTKSEEDLADQFERENDDKKSGSSYDRSSSSSGDSSSSIGAIPGAPDLDALNWDDAGGFGASPAGAAAPGDIEMDMIDDGGGGGIGGGPSSVLGDDD